MVRAVRPWVMGEDPERLVGGQKPDGSEVPKSDVCAFPECGRPVRVVKRKHNRKPYRSGRWCSAHNRQHSRLGLDGMKPLMDRKPRKKRRVT
jgi:hypothetical protein